jgi:hypothetical protein
LKLLNTRSQQPRVNLRVNCIRVAKISRCKHDSFLVEDLGRGNRRALGGENTASANPARTNCTRRARRSQLSNAGPRRST